MIPSIRSSTFFSLSLVALAAGCGTTEPDATPDTVDPVGVWQETRPDVAEVTIRLLDDGTFTRTDADLVAESCVSSSGFWSVDGERLTLRVSEVGGAASSQRLEFDVDRSANALTLTGTEGVNVLEATPDMPSCVDYGWGAWTGRFEVTIDGVPTSFEGLTARVDEDGGGLIIAHDSVPCAACAAEEDLRLTLDTSDTLEPGVYVVTRDPSATRTFVAFFNPAPGDPVFEGFSTDRIAPIGEFALSEVRPDRIVGTFFVTVFPMADGATSPSGATSAELTAGVVDLTYR